MPRSIPSIALLILLQLSNGTAAQDQIEQPSLSGTFEGPLTMGRENMHLAFTFGMNNGEYTAALISSAMGIFGMPADTVIVEGLNITIRIPRLDVEFNGTLRLNETKAAVIRIDGDWFQMSEMVPVVLLPVANPTL